MQKSGHAKIMAVREFGGLYGGRYNEVLLCYFKNTFISFRDGTKLSKRQDDIRVQYFRVRSLRAVPEKKYGGVFDAKHYVFVWVLQG